MTASALLLFAHGSSDPDWARPFLRLQNMLREDQPGRQVELAFLERMSPDFDAAAATLAAAGARRVVVAPLFLAAGAHLRHDLPAMIERAAVRHTLEFQLLPPLGEVDLVLRSIADWLASASEGQR